MCSDSGVCVEDSAGLPIICNGHMITLLSTQWWEMSLLGGCGWSILNDLVTTLWLYPLVCCILWRIALVPLGLAEICGNPKGFTLKGMLNCRKCFGEKKFKDYSFGWWTWLGIEESCVENADIPKTPSLVERTSWDLFSINKGFFLYLACVLVHVCVLGIEARGLHTIATPALWFWVTHLPIHQHSDNSQT
jgi:hypothetical protein